MSSEETFSINGVAKLTGYSVPTVRKRLAALERAGAVQLEGRWSIPLSALYAVGLMSKVEGEATSKAVSKAEGETLQTETIKKLETEIAGLQALVAAQQQTIELTAQAMRMLEAGTQKAPRSSWFRRG